MSGEWKEVNRLTRISKDVRLTGKQKLAAIAEGGGSASARMCTVLAQRIGKPIKCIDKEWYIYDAGKWVLVENGKNCFRGLAVEVQQLGNENHRRVIDLLGFFEDIHQLRMGEKFNGATNDSDRETYLLNCENGTLQIHKETGEIVDKLSHRAEDMFTLSLGRYDDIPCPFFLRTLHEILEHKNDRRLLLDFNASALLPDSRFECALFCIGNGANGKSVITEAIANAIGSEVCSALSLHQICGNERKHMYRLENKLLNVSVETATNMITDSSKFKTIVSGEEFETEKLYQTAGFKMKTNAKLCFLMNSLPAFKGGTEADLRRIRIISFDKSFSGERRDLRLREKLKSEQPGILAYLVSRLPRICGLDELGMGSQNSQRKLDCFRVNTDIVLSFYANCVDLPPYPNSRRAKVLKANLYTTFCKYCRHRDHQVRLTSSQFFKVSRGLFSQLNFDSEVDHGKLGRGACVQGIRFSDYGYSLFSGH